MLDVVETFPLVEMVRLAGSLVELAALRERIQGKSSVGGPVDVATITKHGGFEWIRRKAGSVASTALAAPARAAEA